MRDAAIHRFAEQQGLSLDSGGKSDGRQYALWGEREGRQVQAHTDGHMRVAVLVKEFDGEFIRFVTNTRGDRRRTREAGPVIKTGDPVFDRRFLTQSVPPERGFPFFDDANLRRELLLRRELGRIYLVIGGNGLLLTQDYPRADEEYLAASINLAVRLAKRWDGQEHLDFPD